MAAEICRGVQKAEIHEEGFWPETFLTIVEKAAAF
jgi:hypothetical protein